MKAVKNKGQFQGSKMNTPGKKFADNLYFLGRFLNRRIDKYIQYI